MEKIVFIFGLMLILGCTQVEELPELPVIEDNEGLDTNQDNITEQINETNQPINNTKSPEQIACEEENACECILTYGMCDYIPEGKTYEEVCGNFTQKTKWIPNMRTCNDMNLSVNETNVTNTTEELQELKIPDGLIFSGRYVLVLDDAVLDSTKPGGACAAVSIWYLGNGSVLDKELVCKDSDKTWISPSGEKFRIRLLEIAAGYTHTAKWAKFRVFG